MNKILLNRIIGIVFAIALVFVILIPLTTLFMTIKLALRDVPLSALLWIGLALVVVRLFVYTMKTGKTTV
ncbi:hypothetical protein ACE3MZ_15975 [Paenibacillus sp. WLX1005]|uniref:hypothetical protein n=1 Tax=unclassified Paenibacillus TaxID=185978 RepID=UPI00398416D4